MYPKFRNKWEVKQTNKTKKVEIEEKKIKEKKRTQKRGQRRQKFEIYNKYKVRERE